MVNVLIVAATETELKAFLPLEFEHDKVSLVSAVLGVGKVASMKLRHLLSRYQFDLVLLVGSCGSKDFSSGTVVSPSCLFDLEAISKLNIERKDLPYMSAGNMNDSSFSNVISVEVPQFSPKFSRPQNIRALGGIVYDMEAYSVAEVCFKNNVPFDVLKIVVDGRENEIRTLSEYLQFEAILYKNNFSHLRAMTRERVMSIRDLLHDS